MALLNLHVIEEKDRTMLFEQYKLYVEMADRISQRRMQANTFFISTNTLLFAVMSFVEEASASWKLGVGILGCILCVAWYLLLRSYRHLNMSKFQVIQEIEKLLPLSGYTYEKYLLNKDKPHKYRPLSHVETFVPIVFFIAYTVSIAYTSISIPL